MLNIKSTKGCRNLDSWNRHNALEEYVKIFPRFNVLEGYSRIGKLC